jgi:hypothetical protein
VSAPLDPVTRECLLLLVHDELVRAVTDHLAAGTPADALDELVARRAAALTGEQTRARR